SLFEPRPDATMESDSARIDITYRIEKSGHGYRLAAAKLDLPGIRCAWDVTLHVPGAEDVHVHATGEPPPEFAVSTSMVTIVGGTMPGWRDYRTSSGTSGAYGAMLRAAFEPAADALYAELAGQP